MNLTHKQIDALEGRELDAAVAVHLFAWEWQRKIANYFPPRRPDEPRLCALVPPENDPLGYERINYFAPHWEKLNAPPPPEERFADWAAAARRPLANSIGVSDWGLPYFSDGSDMNATWRVVVAVAVMPSDQTHWKARWDSLGLWCLAPHAAALLICRAALHALLDAQEKQP